jgi:uncharacterized protein YigE (DUF2233 family)
VRLGALLPMLLALAFRDAAPAQAGCRQEVFDGAPFTWCTVDVTREDLRLWLRDEAGDILGTFGRLRDALKRDGQRLRLAMNGGMYHADRAPVGLYIEEGEQLAPIVTSEGPGNFGLLPNGLFCLAGGRAHVIESRAFAASPFDCRFATQSGPMLVIDGQLHPRFLPRSNSRHIRNGVGVRPGGREAVLAISDKPVTFHHFARFFRDRAGTPDALYLDGSISQLYAPGLGRRDAGRPMGPILGVAEPAG